MKNGIVTDIRVLIPDGHNVHSVLAQPHGNRMTRVPLPILSYHTPSEPKPTFEIGKRYRTRDGRVVGPLRSNSHSDIYVLIGSVDGGVMTCTADGRFAVTQQTHGPLDLMPGAVEDECCANSALLEGQVAVLQASVRSLGERADGLATGQTMQRAQISNLNKKIDDGDKAMAEQVNRHESRLNSHRERLADHVNRIGKLEIGVVCDTILAEPEPKRTIKGGWANVYQSANNGNFSVIYPTRGGADAGASTSRLACIQIPDVAEGEGLTGKTAAELTAQDFRNFGGDVGGGA